MSEPREEAIHIAAQCWCDEANSKTIMDDDLAKSFAARLEEQMQRADNLQDSLNDLQNRSDKLAEALKHYSCSYCLYGDKEYPYCLGYKSCKALSLFRGSVDVGGKAETHQE